MNTVTQFTAYIKAYVLCHFLKFHPASYLEWVYSIHVFLKYNLENCNLIWNQIYMIR